MGDKLVTKNFGMGTTGFADQDSPISEWSEDQMVVCLLPGTELAFDEPIATSAWGTPFRQFTHRVAIFRQINRDSQCAHHDALEFPEDNGKTVLLTRLLECQHATVLQLPAEPKNEKEAEEQTRLEIVA